MYICDDDAPYRIHAHCARVNARAIALLACIHTDIHTYANRLQFMILNNYFDIGFSIILIVPHFNQDFIMCLTNFTAAHF